MQTRDVAESILSSTLSGHWPLSPRHAAEAVASWSDEEVEAFVRREFPRVKKWDFDTEGFTLSETNPILPIGEEDPEKTKHLIVGFSLLVGIAAVAFFGARAVWRAARKRIRK